MFIAVELFALRKFQKSPGLWLMSIEHLHHPQLLTRDDTRRVAQVPEVVHRTETWHTILLAIP